MTKWSKKGYAENIKQGLGRAAWRRFCYLNLNQKWSLRGEGG
jgi:hypothetical protein